VPLAVVLAGTLMIVVDFFIVNVMLPSIQRGLHASPSELEWVIAGYGLPFAVFLITAGRLGDRFGRRRMFMWGMVVFTLSSVACGVAWSAGSLIAARVVQGVGAALISPNVLSIIGVLYQGPARVRALRSYGLVMGLGAIGGELLGGVLLSADIAGLAWRACFLVNVPIGLAALAVAPGLVPESRADRPQRADIGGMALITLALVLLVLPLVQGRAWGWPPWSLILLGFAPVAFGAFAAHQVARVRRGRAALLDPRLFRARAFSAGLSTQVVFWCGQASFFLVLTLYLQDGRRLSALDAGLVFTIMAVAFVAASLRAPALTAQLGRSLVALGALVLAAGDAVLFLVVSQVGVGGSVGLLAPGLLLVGAGQGLCITPLASIVMSGLDPERAGAASGPLSTMQQVGNSLGVAITGVIFFGVLPHHGFAGAFEASAVELGGFALLVVAVAQLLPGGATGRARSALGLTLRFRRPGALRLMQTNEDVDGTS
jgi:EmrB/QacA subfamily drug resistance transporter